MLSLLIIMPVLLKTENAFMRLDNDAERTTLRTKQDITSSSQELKIQNNVKTRSSFLFSSTRFSVTSSGNTMGIFSENDSKSPNGDVMRKAESLQQVKHVWFDLNHQNLTNDNDTENYADLVEFYFREELNIDVTILDDQTTWDDVSLNHEEDLVILPDIEEGLNGDEINALINFYRRGGRILVIGSGDERGPVDRAAIHRESLNALLQGMNSGISFRTSSPTGYFPRASFTFNDNNNTATELQVSTSSYLASLIKNTLGSNEISGELFSFLDVNDTNPYTRVVGYLSLGFPIGELDHPIVMASHVGVGKVLVIGSETPFLKKTPTNTPFWDSILSWFQKPLIEADINLPNEWYADEERSLNITISTPFSHDFEWMVNYTLVEKSTSTEIIQATNQNINHDSPIQVSRSYRTPSTDSNISLTFILTVSIRTTDSTEVIEQFLSVNESTIIYKAYQVKETATSLGASVAQNTFSVQENSTMTFFVLIDNNKNEPINVTIQLTSSNAANPQTPINIFSPSSISLTIPARQKDYMINFTTTIIPNNANFEFNDASSINITSMMRIVIEGSVEREETFSLRLFRPLTIFLNDVRFSILQNEKFTLSLTLRNNRLESIDVKLSLKNAQGFLSGFSLTEEEARIAPQSTADLTLTIIHHTSIPYDSGTKTFSLVIEIPKLNVKEEYEITVNVGFSPNNILVGFVIPSLLIFLPPIFAFFNWRKKEQVKIAIMEYIKKNKIAAVSVLVKEFKTKASFVESYLQSNEIKTAFPNGKYFSSVKTFVVIDQDLVNRFKDLVDRNKILRLRDLKKEFAAPVEVSNLLLQLFVEKGYLQGEINEKRTGFVSQKYIEDSIYKGIEEGMLSLSQLSQKLELSQPRVRSYIVELAAAKNIKLYPTELQDVFYTDSGIHQKVSRYLDKKLMASLSEIAVHMKMDRTTLQKALSKADYFNLTTFIDRQGELWIVIAQVTAAVIQAIQKRRQVSLQELASHLKIPGHLAKPLIEALLRTDMIRGGFIGKDTFVEEGWIIEKLRTILPFKEQANLQEVAQELGVNYEAVLAAVKTMISMGILIGFVDKTGTYHEADRPTVEVAASQEGALIRAVPSLTSSLRYLKGDIIYHVEIVNTTNEVLINPVIDVYFEDEYLYPLKTEPEDAGKIVKLKDQDRKWRFFAKLSNILPNQSSSISFLFEPLHLGRTIMRAFLHYESGVTGEQVGVSVPRIVFNVQPPTNLAPSEQNVASCKNILENNPSDLKKIVLSDPSKVKEAFKVLIEIIKKHNFKLVGSGRLSDVKEEWEEEAWLYACIKSAEGKEEIPIVAHVIGSVPSSSLQVTIATPSEELISTLLLSIYEDLEKEARKKVGTETKQAFGRLKSQECNNCGAPLDSLPTIGKDVKCEFCNTVYTYELLA